MSDPKVEDAQPEQPVTSAEDKAMTTEEDAPTTKAKAVESKDTETNGTEKKRERNGVRTYEDGVLKTSAVEDLKDPRKNNKYDPSVLPETDDPQLIRNQVEFYFGDSNLPGDQFLWNATDGTNNLPVKIEKICTFGRMRRFKPISAVVAALRDSDFLEVTGPEGLEEVKRRHPYDPNAPRSKAESRSIYAKGFGDEEPSSQFDIEAFFAPYGPTNSVRLRRTPEKLFKGSVFVEFADDATADAFLALDPKPLWKGQPLKIMTKKQYIDEKAEEIKDGKIEPGPSWHRGRGRGRGVRGGNRGHRNDRDRRGGRDRGDRDPDDWKKRREDDRANGFRDDRNRRDNKGGRGRGRRDDRGPRNNDRNHERKEKNGYESEKSAEYNKNRAREDDDEEDTEAKKIDSKPDIAETPKIEDSKKRAREDDEGESLAKKVDTKSEVAIESS